MFKEAKLLNIIFRIGMFALFIMTVISLSMMFILLGKIMNDQSQSQGEALYNAVPVMRGAFGLYYYIFVLCAVCIIISVLSGYGTYPAAVFFRTVSLAGCAVLFFRGLSVAKLFKTLADIVSQMTYEEMINTSDSEIEALFEQKGYSTAELDAFLNSNESEDAALYMLLAYLVSMVVFLILAITSVKSLSKQSESRAMQQDMYGEAPSPLAKALSDNDILGTAGEMAKDIKDIATFAPPEFNYSEDSDHVRFVDLDDDDL